VLVLQCGAPRRETLEAPLLDALRTRVPPDCYVTCSIPEGMEQMELSETEIDKPGDPSVALEKSFRATCMLIRAASSKPRPCIFAVPVPSTAEWKRTTTFGRGVYSTNTNTMQLPEFHLNIETPSIVVQGVEVAGARGSIADKLLIDAWVSALRRLRPLSDRCSHSLLTPFGTDVLTGGLQDRYGKPGLFAGAPADLRPVKWWLLSVDHERQPGREAGVEREFASMRFMTDGLSA